MATSVAVNYTRVGAALRFRLFRPPAALRLSKAELGLAPGKNVVGTGGIVNDTVEGKAAVRSFGMLDVE